MDKMAQNYTHTINQCPFPGVDILLDYARFNHWKKLGKSYIDFSVLSLQVPVKL